ncbi:MAG TPA: chemotaxis protein CheB, partial [Bryobacteraceae bacterium]|nr:chemotaxis protein CheB [Bryobacteraceae bacterium]
MTKTPGKAAARPFPVAGVGASAGGLEAFTNLLRALPDTTGMAFVFVQHLDPKHVSILTELLARETRMPTREVQDGVDVEPDHVYVIPRNKAMIIEDGALRIHPRSADYAHHLPIDVFFRSLAQELKSLAIGVVLSGNGSDGALGLKAIKTEGGITFAQNLDSAKSTGMPQSAVSTGAVDFVLPPEQIAAELARIGAHPYIAPASTVEEEQPAPPDDGTFAEILGMVRGAHHVDFTHYKETTTRRRILRRMLLNKTERPKDYLAILRQNPAEVENLYEDILIDVTEFFREPEAFEALKQQLAERLFANGSPPQAIRAWVPGCSTGEEVYSVAICLQELLGDHPSEALVQVFATDLSEIALQKARAGIYALDIRAHVSAERLRRFFTKLDNGYQVIKRVRDSCIFARQNVAQDPPFSRLDVLTCRNVLIYLDAVLQKRVLRAFHYALKPSGLLMLGGSESVGVFSNLFHLEDRKHKIYTRKDKAMREPLEFSAGEYVPERMESPAQVAGPGVGPPKDADRLILARYSPAGVVIDEQMDILEFRGDTSRYLKNRPGTATLNLLKLCRDAILLGLRTAIHRARKQQSPARAEGLRIGEDHRQHRFNLEVIPYADSVTRQARFLVLFESATKGAIEKPRALSRGKGVQPKPGRRTETRQQPALAELRQELSAKDEYLKTMTEEYEAAIEELRSANEEILSSNEELQSTNEELETAKEELQSANEEMNTINDELQHRNVELARTGNDLNNVLASVHIPILILSSDLRVRRYTPISEKILNLQPSDIGRPFRDTNLTLKVGALEALLGQVLETLNVSETEVQDLNGHWYSLRMRPYRTEDNRIDGVVLALIDIDPLKRSSEDVVHRLELSDVALREALSHGTDQDLIASHQAMKTLAAGLITGQEDERRRLSREIHDEVNQELALLELDVDTLERNLPASPDEVRVKLSGLRGKVAELSDGLRGLAYRLHPSVLDDLGVAIALQSLCSDFAEREGVRVNYSTSGEPGSIPETVSTSLYRITQEALRNVSQHASAKNVNIRLAVSDGEVALDIQDDGEGFDSDGGRPRNGLGILSMEER